MIYTSLIRIDISGKPVEFICEFDYDSGGVQPMSLFYKEINCDWLQNISHVEDDVLDQTHKIWSENKNKNPDLHRHLCREKPYCCLTKEQQKLLDENNSHCLT